MTTSLCEKAAENSNTQRPRVEQRTAKAKEAQKHETDNRLLPTDTDHWTNSSLMFPTSSSPTSFLSSRHSTYSSDYSSVIEHSARL